MVPEIFEVSQRFISSGTNHILLARKSVCRHRDWAVNNRCDQVQLFNTRLGENEYLPVILVNPNKYNAGELHAEL